MKFKKVLLLVLSLVLVLPFLTEFEVRAFEFIPPEGNFVVSSKETTIVPGVVENEVIYNTSDGQNPVSGFIVDINLGSSVNIMVASKDYDQRGTQTVREMARAAEFRTGRNIVAAINADLNWNGSGISAGPLIIDGVIHSDVPALFFGIKNDGEAVIGDATKFTEVKDDLYQASKGMGWLVRDGQIMTSATSLAPRTAVGLKSDGTVFFYVVEGRMFPRSVGISTGDLAKIMLDYGAVMALNMDGGGSTTYLSKPEGETSLELRSIPSDYGIERESLNSLLVYAEVGDGMFHHAAISTQGDIYTPNSSVQFIARGVDSSGGFAEIPSGLTWKLEDDSFGMIDSNGVFKANSLEGIVNVYLEDTFGRKVGSGKVEIRTPDDITFLQEEYSLGFNETTDFGIRVTYEKRLVKYKEEDIIWEFEESLGVMNDNKFTSNPNESVNGTVKATIYNTEVTAEFSLIVGKLPIVLFDFENDTINEFWEPSSVNNVGSSLSIVHRDSGEPVRFDDKSLRIDFDFTSQIRNPGGAYAGFTDKEGMEEQGVNFQLPGVPTGIGMWIYGTEESQGLWLRTGIGVEGNTNWKAFDLTGEIVGIDWLGWKYVEVSLADFSGPYTMLPGQFLRIMITANSFDKTPLRPVGNIYIDNVTVTYGTNINDSNPPVIYSIQVEEEEVVEGQIFNTNNLTIDAFFKEYDEINASGIYYENVSFYIDGVNYSETEYYYLSLEFNRVSLNNIFLSDGAHEIKIVVTDNAGNQTIKTQYIYIDTGTNNKVYLEEENNVVLGKEYVIALKADEIDKIDNTYLSIQLSRNLADFVVEFSNAFEGYYEYLPGVRLLNIRAERTSDHNVDNIFKIKFLIDRESTENTTVFYKVNIGQYELLDELENERFLTSFSLEPKTIGVEAPLKITSDIIFINDQALFNVYDSDGIPVVGAELFLVNNSTQISLGFTDENGTIFVSDFMEEPTAFTLYAKVEEDFSFEFRGQSLDSYGEMDGTPYSIISNAVKNPEESKNISWFSNSFAEKKDAIIQYALKSEFELKGELSFTQKVGSSVVYTFIGSQFIEDNYAININNVVIDGLLQGKEYVFRVGNGDAWSEIKTFNTGYKYSDVNFVVIGDVQTSNYEDFNANIGKIMLDGKRYDFGIQVGDLVDQANIFSHWNEIMESLSGSIIGNIDIIYALGNHEFYGDENADKANGIFNFPENNGKFYSVEQGIVYVGVISYTLNRTELIEALEWLVNDANSSNAKWKVLVTHQPPYYTNPQGGNNLFNELLPQYVEMAGIDFVFSGHDHAYARTQPLLNGIPNEDGIVYFITGSIAEKRYSIVNNSDFYFDVINNTFNSIYLSVEAKENTFTVTVKDLVDNTIIDYYSKMKETNFHEHEYYLVDGRLICYECNYNRSLEYYTGFAITENNSYIYLINGELVTGWFYIGSDGYYFDTITGHSYNGTYDMYGAEIHFDEKGKHVGGFTGFISHDTITLYFDLGIKLYGWQEIDGYTYYFSTANGYMRSGLSVVGGVTYEFAEDGKLTKGTFVFDGIGTNYYYAGAKAHGWREIEGSRYYFSTNPHGYMRIGQSVIGGQEYYFDETGKLVAENGWLEDEEGIRYNVEGRNVTGWQTISNKQYYFDEASGYLVTGEAVIDGVTYEFAEDGKLTKGTFVFDGIGTNYYYAGAKAHGWREIEGSRYYFSTNPHGYMRIGQSVIGGQEYYFDETGKLVAENGWLEDEEGIRYNVEGRNVTGWQTISNKQYYFDEASGYLVTGEAVIDGVTYEFAEDGKLTKGTFVFDGIGTNYYYAGAKAHGWREIEGSRYYFSTNPHGYMRIGQSVIGGQEYYFDETGKLVAENGWLEDEEGIRYNVEGRNVTGWQTISNKQYYFDEASGYLVTGEAVIDGVTYEFAEDGKLTKGTFVFDGIGTNYYYAGAKAHGWREIEGSRYYFSTNPHGYMRIGQSVIGGQEYYFDETGKLVAENGWLEDEEGIRYNVEGRNVTGWQTISNKQYYFDEASGYLVTGEAVIDGVTYEFAEDGKLTKGTFVFDGIGTNYYYAGAKAHGWREIEGSRYYFSTNPHGYMRIGQSVIGGQEYYFDETGKLVAENGWLEDEEGIRYNVEGRNVTGWQTISNKQYYFDEASGYLVTGEAVIDGVTYEFAEDGKLTKGTFVFDGIGTNYYYAGAKAHGWREIEGSRYYFSTNPHGYMRIGQSVIGGQEYYFDETGKLVAENGWLEDEEGIRYNVEGRNVTGWQTISNKQYYFDEASGYLVTGEAVIDGVTYEFAEDGKLTKGTFVFDGIGTNYYYAGAKAHGWREIEGSRYYFSTNPHGYMRIGQSVIGGQEYYFDETGKLVAENGWLEDEEGIRYNVEGRNVTGWQTISNKQYYFDEASGYLVTGEAVIDGVTYEFAEDGKLTKGTFVFDGIGTNYYYAGAKAHGWREIEGSRYYFSTNPHGYMRIGQSVIGGQEYYFDETGKLVAENGWLEDEELF